ncbi:uncharacterized protein BJ171DRAFT_296045 [Polychytrium aggregatum]|uniref:uncharacterized protein n=1 Tax=Polychytrium aggregatum TaxID=110093 RepID=UPI0022FDDBBD|nr:uncharacterized protein BJ171DRAFT_296045 [Polychytrium aggregatum]KAI9207368.1 hypothetical protein BJ171DRAFT_296045 [Polychytrium aggregatum]
MGANKHVGTHDWCGGREHAGQSHWSVVMLVITRIDEAQMTALRTLFRAGPGTSIGAMHISCGLPKMSMRAKILALQTWARWDDEIADNSKMISIVLRNTRSPPFTGEQFLGHKLLQDKHWQRLMARQDTNPELTATEAFLGTEASALRKKDKTIGTQRSWFHPFLDPDRPLLCTNPEWTLRLARDLRKNRYLRAFPDPANGRARHRQRAQAAQEDDLAIPLREAILTEHMRTAFKRDQQLTAACTPTTSMSALWRAEGYTGSQPILELMIRWRLGIFPGHTKGGSRPCRWCSKNGIKVDLNRSHAQRCVDPKGILARKVNELARTHPSWVKPTVEGVGPIDMLLDLLEFEAKKDREEQQQHTGVGTQTPGRERHGNNNNNHSVGKRGERPGLLIASIVSDTDDDTGISDADVDDDFDDRDRLWSSLPGVIARMGRLRLTGPEVDSDLGSEVSSVSDYDIDFDFLVRTDPTPRPIWDELDELSLDSGGHYCWDTDQSLDLVSHSDHSGDLVPHSDLGGDLVPHSDQSVDLEPHHPEPSSDLASGSNWGGTSESVSESGSEYSPDGNEDNGDRNRARKTNRNIVSGLETIEVPTPSQGRSTDPIPESDDDLGLGQTPGYEINPEYPSHRQTHTPLRASQDPTPHSKPWSGFEMILEGDLDKPTPDIPERDLETCDSLWELLEEVFTRMARRVGWRVGEGRNRGV